MNASARNIPAAGFKALVDDVYRRGRGELGPWAPAYVSFHCADRRRFWLQRFSTEDHFVGFGNTWDVLSPTGDLLGAVTFPPRFRPKIFRDGGIWGVLEDSLGVNQIVRFAYPEGL